MVREYLLYFFGRAFRNIRDNRFLTLVTVTVITVSMLLFSSFLLIYYNIQNAISTWGHDVQVSCYLNDSVSEAEAEVIREEIQALDEVASVDYVSRDQALEMFSESLRGVSGILDDLGSNPLPASLEIKLKDRFQGTEEVASFVRRIERPEFEDIDWSQEWVEKFHAFIRLLRGSGIVLGALLASASVFIISQTLRLGFFARRDEFEILELVGASPMFIRVPFVIEGFIQGFTGAVAAELLLYLLWRAIGGEVNKTLQSSVGALSLRFLPGSYLAMIIVAGMTLGLLGSLASIRKVVKVR